MFRSISFYSMRIGLKNVLKVMLIFLVLVLIAMTYSNRKLTDIISNRELKNAVGNNGNKTKYILYWTPFWGHKDYEMGFEYEPFKQCEYKNCYTTMNRTFMPAHEFDALIFHASIYNRDSDGVPENRSSHQRYIFMNVEAPLYITPDLKQYSAFFNWTMTYRFDSDIVRRHGDIVKGKTNYLTPSKEFLRNKTKLAAWFVSNCFTPSKRELLTKEIQKYVRVDVYGDCGNLTCAKNPNDPKLSSQDCYNMVEEKYKFYFSFENTYCRDYSTEKVYNILQKNIIPVVYGAGNYHRSTPTNSVINVEEFGSVKELTKYLKYLNKHDDEYLKYFQWKKMYKVIRPSRHMACQLCKKLHQPIKESIYHDLEKWWWGENKSECKSEQTLPKIVASILKKYN